VSKAWPKVRLGEVLTERKETPSDEDLFSGRVRIIEKISFNSGKIQLRADGSTKTGMILIRPGDIVVSGINVAKGAVAIYDDTEQEPVAATIHYGAYIPNHDRVDVRFLWWMLRSRFFQYLLLEHVPGGIKTELKAKRLLPIPVPLPPLAEQRRIMARIEELAAQINEARTIQREAVIMINSAMESFIDDIMNRYPLRWQLKNVVSMNPRSGPSFVTNREWSGTSVLMPSSVTGFGVDISKIERGIGNEKISPKDRLVAGDVIIARGNKRDQVGNAGVVPPEAEGWVCANLLMRMKLDEALVNSRFFIYWLRSPSMREYVYKHMTGTNPNIQKINQKTVLGIPFPEKILFAEQEHLVERLDALQAEVDRLKRFHAETAAEIDALLPSILDRAFKGEL
jgi:type I restriction enzyme S subunit